MKDAEIDQVSRSWAGHLATTPKLRVQANALAGDDAGLAHLINTTVQPKVNVAAADVPNVSALVRKAFGGPLPGADAGTCGIVRFDDPAGEP